MTTAVISAGASIVVGLLALIGVIITNNKANKDMQHKLEVAQAVTDTKIDELTREVRMHNNFAQRVPVLEEQIKGINTRLKAVEKQK